MNILCMADLHAPNKNQIESICSFSSSVDMVLWLGDNDEFAIEEISKKFRDKLHVGILGNHDLYDNLEPNGIINANKNHIQKNEISIIGLEGSIKYKEIDNDSKFPSYSQGESLILSERLPYADIIISHTSPYGIHEIDSDVHRGLYGILNFIQRHNPKYSIHGHQHINKVSIMENNTIVIGIYGASILKYRTGELIKIV
ncbi:metallophosphoesterase family protein [Alkaliphilus sp. B6464]|uniref:metallophosphoesterase family protein n=1 Tax=Alkaliphilus sp. B6464 TaxID=2731219 RepID=UPI001BA57429|nr:metallophosphoesterase [Alkaliphilus sp. B6464]QUH22104.1 metallophosphoesterase [Alkaliphilus sp. B6464]